MPQNRRSPPVESFKYLATRRNCARNYTSGLILQPQRDRVLLLGDCTKGAPDHNTSVAVAAATRCWRAPRLTHAAARRATAHPRTSPRRAQPHQSRTTIWRAAPNTIWKKHWRRARVTRRRARARATVATASPRTAATRAHPNKIAELPRELSPMLRATVAR